MNEPWIALVLAAGKGTRMKSERAKILHEIDGRTLLARVLETAARLSPRRVLVVVGHQAEEVRQAHRAYPVEYVVQEPQLGTGHAVLCARPGFEREPGNLLVLYGDVPLLRPATLRELLERHELEGNGVTVLTARVPDPTGYGRILRDDRGGFARIVEDRDLAPEERAIDEINSGIYAFRVPDLLEALDKLTPDNAQGEYYITDTLERIRERGERVGIFRIADAEEISGINDPVQLRGASAVLERRRNAGEGPEGCPICDGLLARQDLILLRRRGMVVSLAPRPYNTGHLWITPERHVVFYESLRGEEADLLFGLCREAEQWLDDTYRPQGFNLGYNSGREGAHLVAHVIPRWAGDANFMPLIGGVSLFPERLPETRRRLLERLGPGEGS